MPEAAIPWLIGAAVATGGAAVGISASNASQQRKAAKEAAANADRQQQALLKEAQDQATQEESTAAQTAARARQRALAQAVGAAGRRSTIKTSSQGDIGIPAGSVKQLIGE